MRRYCLLVILFVSQLGLAQIPPGYYDSAQGLTGEGLRTALYNIIKNHSVQSYSSLYTHYQSTDNNSGVVWDMYSDVPGGTPSYTYTFVGSNQCGSYSSEGDCFNREHSFPKSWFGNAAPMSTDLFHVYPTDGYVNGQRSNYPYGEVSNPYKTSTNGSKSGPCTYPGYSGSAFEPIDEYKGDFARTYFYMMTRYKNNVSTWNSAMLSGDNLSSWANDMLLTWSENDPVSQKETDRNNAVYLIQGNRNPFIDMPSWVDSIWVQIVSVPTLSKTAFDMYVEDANLIVQNSSAESGEILITNMLGSVIQRLELLPGENSIPLPPTPGVYIAKAVINKKSHSLKFIR